MAVVIDDHILLDLIVGEASPAVRESVQRDEVYTTGCWYYRLARASVAGTGTGSLSARLEAQGPAERDAALESLRRLPDAVGLLSLRTVAPVMAALRVRRPLNMLNAEALAVALVAGARLRVAISSELLHDGAADLGVDYQASPEEPEDTQDPPPSRQRWMRREVFR